MKISGKIIISFLIIALMTLIVGIVGITDLRKVNSQHENLFQNYGNTQGMIGKVNIDFLRFRMKVRDMILDKDVSKVRKYADDIKAEEYDMQTNLDLYQKTLSAQADIDVFNSLVAAIEKYKIYRDRITELCLTGKFDEAYSVMRSIDSTSASTAADNILTDIVNSNIAAGARVNEQVDKNVNQTSWVLIGIITAAVFGAAVLGIFISRSISLPIRELAQGALQLAEGDTSVDFAIHTKGEVGMLASAFRSVIETLKNMMTDAELLTESAIRGDLHIRADAARNNGDFRKIIEGVNKTLDILVGHIDSISAPVMIIDTDHSIRYMNKTGAAMLERTQEQLLGQKCYDYFKTSDCKTAKCACTRAMRENARVEHETDAHPGGMNLDISYIGVPIKDNSQKVIGALEIVTDMTAVKAAQRLAEKQARYQTEHIDRLVVNLERLARGELECDMKVMPPDTETQSLYELFSQVSNNLHGSMDAIKGYIIEVAQVLAEVSGGNLTVEIHSSYRGEFIQIKDSINSIIDSLNTVLSEINSAAEQVNTGASQVSGGAQLLAAGSAEQASSIEELSVSIAKIAEQAAENSSNVKTATQYVEQANANVKDGDEHMKQLTEAMANIGSASNQISNITKVIEDIAFQTNILALNAAIEAARAGNAGKGFAVVADEVRNLAAKSAKAAKQTAELIQASAATVADGSQITEQTAQILHSIEEKTRQVNEIINRINEASSEQAIAIDQIKQGLAQVSSVVQTNAATAEENSATSEEMSAQAATLREEVGKFKLNSGYEMGGITAISLRKEFPRANAAEFEAASALGKY